MGEFLGFFIVILAIGWGTAFAALHFRRQMKRLDEGVDHEILARLLEDMDQISTRLSRLEEDVDFFKELRAPDTHGRLPGLSRSEEEEPAKEQEPASDND